MSIHTDKPGTLDLYARHVIPTYGRFPLALARGEGTRVWDEGGRAYLDFGTGIAVDSLGHCHPAVREALAAQASTLIHTSNLYYTRPQADLAVRLCGLVGAPGKVFFCNSGAEANEGLYKLARKNGAPLGRHEIITLDGSFHGRTLAGIAATGQLKVKLGFGPPVAGFVNVPARLECVDNAAGPRAAAVLVEPLQGEGGVHPMRADFLRGLRALCDARGMLLLYDEVQCGLGRTGHWGGWHAVGAPDATPDGISWAKGIGGGFPLGAFWARDRDAAPGGSLADLLGPGTHGTTYGGSPLASAVGLAVLSAMEKENLLANAAERGAQLRTAVVDMRSPLVVDVRGAGLLLGIEIEGFRWRGQSEPDTRPPALRLTLKLLENGLLVVPAGESVLRLLPPLNVSAAECDEAAGILRETLALAEPLP